MSWQVTTDNRGTDISANTSPFPDKRWSCSMTHKPPGYIDGIEVVGLLIDDEWWITACEDGDDRYFKPRGPYSEVQCRTLLTMLTRPG